MATKTYDPSQVFPKARASYEDGASLRYLRRKFGLTDGELKDVAPEEFVDHPKPEGLGGY